MWHKSPSKYRDLIKYELKVVCLETISIRLFVMELPNSYYVTMDRTMKTNPQMTKAYSRI